MLCHAVPCCAGSMPWAQAAGEAARDLPRNVRGFPGPWSDTMVLPWHVAILVASTSSTQRSQRCSCLFPLHVFSWRVFLTRNEVAVKFFADFSNLGSCSSEALACSECKTLCRKRYRAKRLQSYLAVVLPRSEETRNQQQLSKNIVELHNCSEFDYVCLKLLIIKC